MWSRRKDTIFAKIINKHIIVLLGLLIGAGWGYSVGWNSSEPKEAISIVKEMKTSDSKSEVLVENVFWVPVQTKNGEIINQELEEYVCGVVAAEMPANFAFEALKAQAVAARSYCVHYLSGKEYIPAGTSAQDWLSIAEQKNRWGNNYETYRDKIALAVAETKGEVLYWQDSVITAAYHASCGGVGTASAKEVWGGDVAYLKNVECPHGQDKYSGVEHIFTKEEIAQAIGVNSVKNIRITSYTISGRAAVIQIDGVEYETTQIRTALALPSSVIEVKVQGDNVIITSFGSGHGVGMCQYGAEYYAKEGWNYQQILEHFYPETTIGQV